MKRSIAFLTLVFFASLAYAQHTPEHAALEKLSFLTGTWEVTSETRLSANGPWETTKGKSIIEKAVGNSILEENHTSSRQNKPFITKTLFALNNQSQKFQRSFIDSEHGTIVDFEGTRMADSVVFDKTWVYANGSTVKLRVVYNIISPSEFTVKSMRMPESMTVWDTTSRIRYQKKKLRPSI